MKENLEKTLSSGELMKSRLFDQLETSEVCLDMPSNAKLNALNRRMELCCDFIEINPLARVMDPLLKGKPTSALSHQNSHSRSLRLRFHPQTTQTTHRRWTFLARLHYFRSL
jgi:hypothetical protein